MNLASKSGSAAKKLAWKDQARATMPLTSTTTTTTARKAAISFADQQKENTWKWKLAIAFSINVMSNTDGTKVRFDAKLGEILKTLSEVAGKGKLDAVILPLSTAHKGTLSLLSVEELSKHIVTWKENYAEMENLRWSRDSPR